MRAHSPWPLMALLLILASCKGEPDFDERYARQAEDLEATARNMQQELENRIAASDLIHNAAPENARNAAEDHDGGPG